MSLLISNVLYLERKRSRRHDFMIAVPAIIEPLKSDSKADVGEWFYDIFHYFLKRLVIV